MVPAAFFVASSSLDQFFLRITSPIPELAGSFPVEEAPVKIAPLSFMAAAHQWVPPAQLVFSPCSTSPLFHGSFSHNPFGGRHRELRVRAASHAAASMAGWSGVLFETIEELSRKVRDPAEVLADSDDRLTAREIRLVLVYFAQEGRDCWCALEVFDWLQRERGVDEETAELMVSIMCQWVVRLVGGPHVVGEVVELLKDMDCVGLRPRFSMIEKVIGLYWEMGKKEAAVGFVEEVLRKGVEFVDEEGSKGGPAGYLAWKLMVSCSSHYLLSSNALS